MNICEIELHAAGLYNNMVGDAYHKDDRNVDFQQIFQLAWAAAIHFDEQFVLERKKLAESDPSWSAARRKCKKRDGGKCKLCGAAGANAVHHIITVELAPLLVAKLWNLILLCKGCHLVVTGNEEEQSQAAGPSRRNCLAPIAMLAIGSDGRQTAGVNQQTNNE
jgi:hypothetical protein